MPNVLSDLISLIIFSAKNDTDKGFIDFRNPILFNTVKTIIPIFSPLLINSGCLIKIGG